MSLRSCAREIESYVEMNLETLSFGLPVEEIGRTCDDLCQNYRTLACCALLLSADTDRFLHLLHRSGQIRLHFLERCAERSGYHDAYGATGNSAGFFDAIAARSFQLASKIAKSSFGDWLEGTEYHDDFCFANFCHLVLQGAELRPKKESLLEFKEAIGNEESARLSVCESLFELDQQKFEEGFEALLDQRKADLDEERSQFFPDDRIVFRTQSRIFVEGLAVLNLADRLGLKTLSEYQYCPVMARLPMVTPFPEASPISLLNL